MNSTTKDCQQINVSFDKFSHALPGQNKDAAVLLRVVGGD